MSAPVKDVWQALTDSPEEATEMRLRAQLLRRVNQEIKSWGISQRKAGARLGIGGPRVNDLLKGKIEKFSLTFMVRLAVKAGLTPELTINGTK